MKKMIGFIEGVAFSWILCVAMAVGYGVCQERDKKYIKRMPNENKNSTKNSVEDEI